MEIHLDQILFQMINFGIVLFVLVKFMYKPILRILEQRANKIDEGLAAAEQNLEEQANIEKLKLLELQKTEKKAAKIIADAKNQADILSKDLIEKAKAETSKMVQREEEALKARLENQEQKLTAKISDLTITTTKAILKDALTPNHQKEILNYQIKQLKKFKVN